MRSPSTTSAAVQVCRAAFGSMPSILLHTFRCLRACYLLDKDRRNPVPIHRLHSKPPAIKLHRFSRFRNVSQLEKHVAGNGLESAVGRQLDAISRSQIENAGGSVEFHAIRID